MTLMLCIHEAGHLLAARWRRVPADPPVFLPFVGALMLIDAEARHQAGQPDDGAFVAIGGPALGTAGACACWALGVGPMLITRFLMGGTAALDAPALVEGRLRWAYGMGYTLLVAVTALGLV